MKFKLYSVYDMVVKSYSPPFLAQTDAVAMRSVLTVVRDPNSPLAQHPHDYRLFELGSFDDESGDVSSLHPHHLVVDVINLIPSPKVES